ncbi:MAG: homoserine O-succinyltransferase MetX [Gammaproteobacteria bacterium]
MNGEKSIGEVVPQTASFAQPLRLACGKTLPQWEISYETYGRPDANMQNAVLVCHALSGSQHAAGRRPGDSQNTGWWDNFIGPGKPLDTNYFYVVSPNNLGGCHGSTGPASIHPEDGRAYGSRFPQVTVEDWVRAQNILAEKLGIGQFAAVVGGSLGGMQALRWAADFPDKVRAVVAVAAAAKLSAINIGFNDIARQAIMRDPDFCGGDYYESGRYPHRGLGIARMLGHVTYLSDAHMAARFGRERREDAEMFQVESYLRYQGKKFSGNFDANTYLLMTRALDAFDPAAECGGDLARALAPVRAKLLLVSFSSDWRFSPARSEELTRALLRARKDVSYIEIESQEGHDSFLLADKTYHNAVRAFMDGLKTNELKTPSGAREDSNAS